MSWANNNLKFFSRDPETPIRYCFGLQILLGSLIKDNSVPTVRAGAVHREN